MACPLCLGTDAAADCTAGRCRFQEEIEAQQAARERDRLEERRINDALSPLDDDPGDGCLVCGQQSCSCDARFEDSRDG